MKLPINAGVFTLKQNTTNPTNILLQKNTHYLIPIYQRPYSWTSIQLQKLLSDIFLSFQEYHPHDTQHQEFMFIGTMQLSDNHEIIDGQQRISTLLLFLRILQLKYITIIELQELDFTWLTTKVNSGKQQEKLNSFLAITSLEDLKENDLNLYIHNAALIHRFFNEEVAKLEENHVFNPTAFVTYLYKGIYFVIIKTKASLSKTLQIFDVINTTGLDLNAGDLFKIRMFEYLNKDGQNDEVFEKISQLYQLIDRKNEEFGRNLINIQDILSIYQIYLIAKYKLPSVLYTYGNTTFYDRLFETLFNLNKWEHFKNNVEGGKVKLCLKELTQLVEVRFEWEQKWQTKSYVTAKDAGLLYLWWQSRYSKFWNYTFVLLFCYRSQDDRYQKLTEVTKKLVKVYLIYSIVYQKSVNYIKGSFNNTLLQYLVHHDHQKVMEHIQSLLDTCTHQHQRLREILHGNLLYNAKMKNIICRLSALLEENHSTQDAQKIEAIISTLFHESIDIEHIQPYRDENPEIREKVQEEWGNDLHSIGNLVVLEQKLNRSIGNHQAKKLNAYQKSELCIVKQQLVGYYQGKWDLKSCQSRKKAEITKLYKFLISEQNK